MTIKGSWQRPIADQKHFDSKYERIFRKQGEKLSAAVAGVSSSAQKVRDELAGNGDTFEEAGNVNDEMKLHQEKHDPTNQRGK